MQGLILDARHALRALARSRGFTAAAALTLGLGVAANTSVFAVVKGVLLDPLPWPEPDRLVRVWSNWPERDLTYFSVSVLDAADWREQSTTLSGLAVFERQRGVVVRVEGGEPREEQAARASHQLFALLGVEPQLGRLFNASEDRAGGERVAVITHAFWLTELGGDAGAVGSAITVDGEPYTVIGVLPPSFLVPRHPASIWTALGAAPRPEWEDRGNRFLRVFGRLAPGATVESARAELTAIAARLAASYPGTNANWTITLEPLEQQVVDATFPRAALLLACVVAIVLLIAAANVTNLFLSRSLGRRHETAARMALGASRAQVVRYWLSEGLLLGLLAGASGLLLGVWGIELLRSLNPESVPRLEEIGIDAGVVLFTLALSLLAGATLGMGPGVQSSRADIMGVLRDAGRGLSASRRTGRLRSVMLVGQTALTLVLLVSAGLLARSFQRLIAIDHGYDARDVLTARITLPPAAYADGDRILGFYRNLMERVSATPGVVSVAAVSSGPLGGPNSARSFVPEHMESPEAGSLPDANYRVITPGYFETMGIRLASGRDFTEAERGRADVVIISETMARLHWPGDPIGERLRISGSPNEPWRTIVGVVADVRYYEVESEEVRPMFYLPHRAVPAMTLMIRVRGETAATATAVRQTLAALDPELAPGVMVTQQELVDNAFAGRRFQLVLFGTFGVLALVLAAVGVWSLTAHAVAQRTAELGVRIALGADPVALLRTVLRQTLTLSALGTLLGLGGAYAATEALRSLLFRTEPTDVPAFAVTTAALLLVTLFAAWWPARRAMRVDPVAAMRSQAY
jgi:predicted permease